MNKPNAIRSFTDLTTWKEGHKLVISINKITQDFPREEIYSLTDQICRAASSITANVAEGFGRQTYKEKVQFYYQAQGSLSELKNFILIAKDVGYLKERVLESLFYQANTAHQLLQGLIQKSKTFIHHKL